MSIILLVIIVSQLLGVYRFIKEIRTCKTQLSLGGKLFRGIWLVVEGLAFVSIIVYGYLCIRVGLATEIGVQQGYSWGAFVICTFVALPINLVALILRISYVVVVGKRRKREAA